MRVGIQQIYRCKQEKKIRNLTKERRGTLIPKQLKNVDVEFLEKEDNITTLPGKKDTKTVHKEAET